MSVFDVPSQLSDLESAAGGRGELAGTDPVLVKAFARRIGRSIVNAGALTAQLHKAFPDALRGDFRGARRVAYYRSPPPDNEQPGDKALREAFEEGLVGGLALGGVLTVGVEEQGTDPSQVPWYHDQQMSSVDSVDLPGGRLALVFTLDGEKGSYGIKDSAPTLRCRSCRWHRADGSAAAPLNASARSGRVRQVQSLPFLVSLGVAAAIVPAAVRGLRSRGSCGRTTGARQVAFPAGIALVIARRWWRSSRSR